VDYVVFLVSELYLLNFIILSFSFLANLGMAAESMPAGPMPVTVSAEVVQREWHCRVPDPKDSFKEPAYKRVPARRQSIKKFLWAGVPVVTAGIVLLLGIGLYSKASPSAAPPNDPSPTVVPPDAPVIVTPSSIGSTISTESGGNSQDELTPPPNAADNAADTVSTRVRKKIRRISGERRQPPRLDTSSTGQRTLNNLYDLYRLIENYDFDYIEKLEKAQEDLCELKSLVKAITAAKPKEQQGFLIIKESYARSQFLEIAKAIANIDRMQRQEKCKELHIPLPLQRNLRKLQEFYKNIKTDVVLKRHEKPKNSKP
jgi:hypothetical protein